MGRRARRQTMAASGLGSGWRRARTSRTAREWRRRWPDFPGISAAGWLAFDIEPHLEISLKIPFAGQHVIVRQESLHLGGGGIGFAVFKAVMRQHQPDPRVISGNGV